MKTDEFVVQAVNVVLAICITCVVVGAYRFGRDDQSDDQQQKCVSYHSDMSHNKVKDFCKELLKFEKK